MLFFIYFIEMSESTNEEISSTFPLDVGLSRDVPD